MRVLLSLLTLSAGLVFAEPVTQTYVERESGPLLIDLHLPRQSADTLAPTILWMHGGGWQNGSRENMKLVEWLIEHGYAIASIDYRLTQVASFPAQQEDCLAALEWIRNHGEKHGLDPAHLVVSGLSAGAHLASLTGFVDAHGEQPIRGIIHFYGPSDFIRMARYAREPDAPLNQPESNVYRLLGGPLADRLSLAEEASPVSHLDENDPPSLILVGDQDSLMAQRQCRRLHDAAIAAGLRSEFHLIPGAGHGGPEFSDQERQSIILKFLTSLKS